MAEQEILSLFEKGAPPSNVKYTKYSKYRCDVAGNISKTIADIVYGTINSKSPFAVEKRQDFIQFIRNWGSGGTHAGNHLNLKLSNYMLAIDLYNESHHQAYEVEEILHYAKEEHLSNHKTPLQGILEHFKSLDTIRKDRNEFLEIVSQRDQEKLQHFTVSKNVKSFELADDFFKSFVYNNEKVDVDNKLKTTAENNAYREQQIEFAYALLNLNRTKEDIKAFKRIIKNLTFYKHLNNDEYDFLNYLLLGSGAPMEMLVAAMDSFSFLFEKPLIKIATKLLEMDDYAARTSFLSDSAEVKVISEATLASEIVKRSVFNVLYELHALNQYQGNLLELIGIIFNKDCLDCCLVFSCSTVGT